MKIKGFVLFIIIASCFSCSEEVLPKPKAQLRLEYEVNTYQKILTDCPYSIEISSYAIIDFRDNCWAKIHYSNLDATLHLTYRRIEKDLNSVLKEVEKLTYEHTVKADAINPRDYENKAKKVYGKIVNVQGNVASNIQFYVTDSIKNVLFASLYFNVKPNYDSIRPALNYIEKDIVNLIETVEWKEE